MTHVLVADDYPDTAESIGMVITMLGHHVEVAHTAEAALDIVERFQPDVVLMDLFMPGLGGFDAAREIRGRVRDKRLVLAAITGSTRLADHARARAAGFDHVLLKPFGVAHAVELMGAVRSVARS